MLGAAVESVRWAWEQVRPRFVQFTLAIIAIALGVGLSGAVLLANAALQEAFERASKALAGRADVQITNVGGGLLPEDVIPVARGVPGVEAAAPLLVGTAYLTKGGNDPIHIIGVDMLDDATVRTYRSAVNSEIENPLAFLNQPDSAMITETFAARHGLARGSRFAVQAPAGMKMLTAREILRGTGVGGALSENVVLMDLYSAQELLGVPAAVTRIDVVLLEGYDVEDVMAELASRMPASIVVERTEDANGRALAALAGFQLLFSVIAALGLLLGSLIAQNRLATVYESRFWEVGVSRSQGMWPGVVLRRLMLEAALVCGIGVLVGLPLAIVLAQWVAEPLGTAMSMNVRQEVAVAWVPPRFLPLAIAAVAGLASGLAGAWRPARSASRLVVSEVLARGRSRAPWPEAAATHWIRGVVCLSAIVLIGITVSLGEPTGIVASLGMLATVVAGNLMIRPLLRAVVRPLSALLGPTASVGLDDQSLVPSRAIGAARLLMVGGAIVIWLSNVGSSFESYIVNLVMAPLSRADLVIDSSANVTAMGAGGPLLSDEIVSELAKIPGIEAVGGQRDGAVSTPPTGISSVDRAFFREDGFGDWRLEEGALPNALERVARGEAVLANFPPDRPAVVGQTIRLLSPTGWLERPIAAISRATSISPAGDVVMSRDLYKKRWLDHTILRAFVKLSDGADAAVVRQTIQKTLGGRYGLRVLSSDELGSWFADSIRRGFLVAQAIGALTLVILLLGTADALAADVVERTREIGTMRALGSSPFGIARMILGQAAGIAVVGVGLGVLVGLGWSVAFTYGVVPPLLGWRPDLHVPIEVIGQSAFLGLVACLVGASLPALRASRIPIANALRVE